MKKFLVVLALASTSTLVAYGQTSTADDVCKKLEYAELKDTPKDELVRTYCTYGALAEIQDKLFYKLIDLSHEADNLGMEDNAKETRDKANTARLQGTQCGQEKERIGKVLLRTYGVSKPSPADCVDAAKKAQQADKK